MSQDLCATTIAGFDVLAWYTNLQRRTYQSQGRAERTLCLLFKGIAE